ncbi:MAG TPA: hypothetical protein PLW01_03795 [Agitococcus sp.]|nr:hypothetical protein [Agitococcus sp.]
MLKIKSLTILILLSSSLYANDHDVDLGFDLDGKYQQQNYNNATSKSYRLGLQPWLLIDNWLFYAELPFEARENTTQSSQTIYARTSTGRVIRRIPPQTINTKQVQQQEGLADASIGLSYVFFRQNWQHNMGLDYKFDNGDANLGLGSDSLETSASIATTFSYNMLSLNAQAGYLWVGGNNLNQNKDYAFASTSITWQAHPTLKISLSYNNQTEPYHNAPEQAFIQSRVDWRINRALKIYSSYGQYLQQHISLPESEFSVGAKFLF